MAATTTSSRDFNVQVLTDVVRGVFAGRNALLGASPLAASGAIAVNGQMPDGRDRIDQTITVPYFGTIGDFADNSENVAAVPVALGMTNETATVVRGSLAFEATRWSRNSGPMDGDPYLEAARQIVVAAGRYMDQKCITKAATTPLIKDVYNTSVPGHLDWDTVIDAAALWGDEGDDIAGMVVHSRVEAGLRKLRDQNGRPLLLDNMSMDRRVRTFAGIPLHVSDRVPLTGSTMSSVTSAGTSPPTLTLTGTPTGCWNLRLKCIVGGARGTFTFQFSTDGGNTWSATLTSAAAVPLTDTATDSIVGNNGTTGLTANFANASATNDNTWASNAIPKATTLILQRNSMAFWYTASAMELLTDRDILKDNDVAAMHIYCAPHLYRRRAGGTKCGVVAVTTNVPGFIS